MEKNKNQPLVIDLNKEKENVYIGATVEIPEGYYLQIVQKGKLLPALFDGIITLDNDSIPELEIDDVSALDTRFFLICYEFPLEFNFENCYADLNKGYPLNYSFTLPKTIFTFSRPDLLLEHLFAFDEETKEGIYFYESNLKGFIELTIKNEIEETLLLQPFFNPENGSIEYETLSEEHQKFMDYIAQIEANLEEMFDSLGIQVEIQIEDFQSVCPVEEFYVEEA